MILHQLWYNFLSRWRRLTSQFVLFFSWRLFRLLCVPVADERLDDVRRSFVTSLESDVWKLMIFCTQKSMPCTGRWGHFGSIPLGKCSGQSSWFGTSWFDLNYLGTTDELLRCFSNVFFCNHFLAIFNHINLEICWTANRFVFRGCIWLVDDADEVKEVDRCLGQRLWPQNNPCCAAAIRCVL